MKTEIDPVLVEAVEITKIDRAEDLVRILDPEKAADRVLIGAINGWASVIKKQGEERAGT